MWVPVGDDGSKYCATCEKATNSNRIIEIGKLDAGKQVNQHQLVDHCISTKHVQRLKTPASSANPGAAGAGEPLLTTTMHASIDAVHVDGNVPSPTAHEPGAHTHSAAVPETPTTPVLHNQDYIPTPPAPYQPLHKALDFNNLFFNCLSGTHCAFLQTEATWQHECWCLQQAGTEELGTGVHNIDDWEIYFGPGPGLAPWNQCHASNSASSLSALTPLRRGCWNQESDFLES